MRCDDISYINLCIYFAHELSLVCHLHRKKRHWDRLEVATDTDGNGQSNWNIISRLKIPFKTNFLKSFPKIFRINSQGQEASVLLHCLLAPIFQQKSKTSSRKRTPVDECGKIKSKIKSLPKNKTFEIDKHSTVLYRELYAIANHFLIIYLILEKIPK